MTLINRFELLRMGYTSKQIDEELFYKDIELIIILEGLREEREIKKLAAGVAMAFGGSKSGDNKNGRRR
jgi:hypothetical protein